MGDLTLGVGFWALAALGLVAAVVYGVYFLRRPPSFLRAFAKTGFMGAFAGALILAQAPPPLVLAILFSAAGDFFLAFDKKWVLPLGILAFLGTQLLYTLMFGAIWFFSGDNSPLWPRYGAMVLVIATSLGFLVWFWRSDLRGRAFSGVLTIAALFSSGLLLPYYLFVTFAFPRVIAERGISPILSIEAWAPLALLLTSLGFLLVRRDLGIVRLTAMVYAGAITLMGVVSMWLPWVGWPASLGAILFLVSDFVLATELFRMPADAPARRVTAPVVWWTYVAAQILIVTGLILIVRAGV